VAVLARGALAAFFWLTAISFIRSYVIKDGRLFLALMADGGIYEFEPLPVSAK